MNGKNETGLSLVNCKKVGNRLLTHYISVNEQATYHKRLATFLDVVCKYVGFANTLMFKRLENPKNGRLPLHWTLTDINNIK